MTFPSLDAAVRWFAPLWLDRDYPTRLHLHAVEPDSVLGSPAIAPKFLRYLSASAMDVSVIEETRTCRHPRLDRHEPSFACPDCDGTNVYVAERVVYRDPLLAAIENLRRRPAPWPRGVIPASALILELAGCGFRIDTVAGKLLMRPDVCAGYAVVALAQLKSRYLEAPPTRIAWTAKSASQQAAEAVA